MASIATQSRSKKKASHSAGQNTSDESVMGHNHTQVSMDSDTGDNKAKRRKKWRWGKYRNAMITRATNCRKNFLPKLLTLFPTQQQNNYLIMAKNILELVV